MTNVKGDYAAVNGLRLYYEIHGQGKPLILLHGGLNNVTSKRQLDLQMNDN